LAALFGELDERDGFHSRPNECRIVVSQVTGLLQVNKCVRNISKVCAREFGPQASGFHLSMLESSG
jgi:hypothetical protein